VGTLVGRGAGGEGSVTVAGASRKRRRGRRLVRRRGCGSPVGFPAYLRRLHVAGPVRPPALLLGRQCWRNHGEEEEERGGGGRPRTLARFCLLYLLPCLPCSVLEHAGPEAWAENFEFLFVKNRINTRGNQNLFVCFVYFQSVVLITSLFHG
jgi:hypothetical protein